MMKNLIGRKTKTIKKKIIAGIEFSEEQFSEIQEAFNEFDIDGDGTITTKVGYKQEKMDRFEVSCLFQELGMVMRRLGEFTTEEELRVMIDQVDQVRLGMVNSKLSHDQDKNGSIELDEFLTMMATRVKMNQKIKDVFNVFDQDCDG